MAFEPYTRVDFGPAKAGLGAVGYTLVKAGRPIGPRVTRGVEDLGDGHYGAAVEYPSHFRGQLVWDTGGPSPQTVTFDVTPEEGAIEAIARRENGKRAAPSRPRPAPRARVVPPDAPHLAQRSALAACVTPPAVPVVGRIDDIAVTPRMKTVVVRAGQSPSVQWTMQDDVCGAIDLTACGVGDPNLVLGTLRVAPDCRNYHVDFPASSPDPASGLMVAEVSPERLGGPGIYVAEMGVFDAEGTFMAVSNQFYLVVEEGLFAGSEWRGPPTLAEIRLELRDSSPLENDLLDDSLAFDNSEIAAALRNAVDYWNESLPPIYVGYTTQNFPYRYWWKHAAKAQLFRMAAESHRRNQVSYSAGGVQFDDHAQKAQQYDQAAGELWNEYRQWVQQKKMSLNLEMGWGTQLSDYSRI